MPETLVDHYAALNLPPTADLPGIENAYARLSAELAQQTRFDETAAAALLRINQAYAVLSQPARRRDYDQVFLALERSQAEQAAAVIQRNATARRWLIRGVLFGALGVEAMLLIAFTV